jgi:F0F1-type ATP synthase assembly protein I
MDFRFKYNRHKPPPEQVAREEQQEVEVERRAQGLAYGLSIPATLLGSVFSGWILGTWLDKQFHTSFLVIVFILIGTAAGLTMTIQLLSRLNQK